MHCSVLEEYVIDVIMPFTSYTQGAAHARCSIHSHLSKSQLLLSLETCLQLSRDSCVSPAVHTLHFGITDWIKTPASRRRSSNTSSLLLSSSCVEQRNPSHSSEIKVLYYPCLASRSSPLPGFNGIDAVYTPGRRGMRGTGYAFHMVDHHLTARQAS